MAYAHLIDGAWHEVSGAFIDADGIQRPANWIDCASAAELAAAGLVEIIENEPPEQVRAATPTLTDVDGTPRRVWETEEYTPAEAAALMRERAQAYREQRRTQSLPVWGVFADRPVVVKMTQEGREAIQGAFSYASFLLQNGASPSFTFDDEEGVEVTLTAQQTIALGLNVAVFTGTCDNALRQVRRTIAEAEAAEASAADIFAIDVTAGYP